jgi:hypothetical protein
MIIRTKNSTYEIQGKWIRKVEGKAQGLDRNFTEFQEFIFMPEVGKRLMVSFGSRFLRTSTIQSIEESE